MKNPFWMLRSKLGWLNFFVLQWFFVRLQEVGETNPDGSWKHLRWELLWAPVPLTGWWQRYWFVYMGACAQRLTRQPSGHVPKRVMMKKRLLQLLDNGPKSSYSLESRMRDEGFRTGRVIFAALEELIAYGEVQIKARQDGKPWLYQKSRRTLDA